MSYILTHVFQLTSFLQKNWTENSGNHLESTSNLKFELQLIDLCILIRSAMYLEKPALYCDQFFLGLGTLKMLHKMNLLSDIF